MKIIISPAKQMKSNEDTYFPLTSPLYLEKAKKLVGHLSKLSYQQLKTVLNCSDSLAKKAFENYQTIDFDRNPSMAILSYNGIQYQYMAPSVFTDEEFAYIQDHLFILSGLYGILRPFDGIVSYRLEMQAKCPFSLYEYWNQDLADAIQDDTILNLASEEYAKCIRKYKKLIDVRFCQRVQGKLKEKGVYAKMARGDMVRYLAQNQIETIDQVKTFNYQNYVFSPEDSTGSLLTFIQE
ncbi:peroxide stress protein YaaA [Faecalitalea cylindroides]|uniref:peroxide stress protein YaaA n=1 Tax=Faecalitalea cylindroides TaxID=39483 RepID=UPI0023312457|nr:peroxide stress protein YaaA [Faecalitalea cylindroides]MDB7953033.1 peroxide stress protein YaaA [Faecalitalea cylindroides]MDB7959388.1 peroxide stress protein YaaA [Faecalitalea cylindroides]MDB7961174.1 peroxide stress protein YaaA [Faecalitalea cylindroides]MDB7963653.1 peroxide stress protein YaaA [Faecalitalea cylindroides]MDB7965136.1 peroxide stress protein YaaA [Faecalitalea cylindroides]